MKKHFLVEVSFLNSVPLICLAEERTPTPKPPEPFLMSSKEVRMNILIYQPLFPIVSNSPVRFNYEYLKYT